MYLDEEGHLIMPLGDQPEPICPKCKKPIQWVLDMSSFSTLSQFRKGGFVLMHARCAWIPSAFTRERTRAKENR